MKIRSGFISNSSSCSFVLGFGIVKDKGSLLKYIEENHLYAGFSSGEERKRQYGSVTCWASTEIFNGDRVYIDYQPDRDVELVELYAQVDIPDDEDGDYDHDYEEEDSDEMKAIWALQDHPSVENFKTTYGAGRNG